MFQGTAISSEHTSQFLLPGNVAELRCSPPLRRSLEQLFRLFLPVCIPGHRTNRSDYTRGQSQETGSLSRLFGSVETTAKCVSVGPAYCRERLQNPVRFSSASMQRGESHSGGPRAGSGYGMRSRYSLEEGGHRGGPSSPKRVWVLQPVLRSSQEGLMVGSMHSILDLRHLNRSVSRLNLKMFKQSCLRSGPRTGLSRSM